MFKFFFPLIVFYLLVIFSCNEKKAENFYPSFDEDKKTGENDSENKILPDNSESVDQSEIQDIDDVMNEKDDISEKSDSNDEEIEKKDDTGHDFDNLLNDEDNLPECFNKTCLSHEDCDVKKGVCEGYSNDEEYACVPDVSEFGYQGEGTCRKINCNKNSDCRADLGYMCINFGLEVPDFNNGKSGCLLSVIGEKCSEEGKKRCQFGFEIALECVDGIWKPTYCEEGDVCLNGECIPEPTDNDEINDNDIVPPIEICDNVDNTGEGTIDEGCDKDGDGWCDINMIVVGTPDVCPKGALDCDDNNSDIYPGSKIHQEGIDYDCDNRKEYQATIVLSVDDELVELCANGRHFIKDHVYPNPPGPNHEFGPNYRAWTYADTYSGEKLVLESGINVIGVHGKDTGAAISAFVATIHVSGIMIVTDGVLPPASGIAYKPSDPEWTQSDWRYFPTVASGPNGDWCDKWFDDSEWGPAIKAGESPTSNENWGNLGTVPWTTTACGAIMCPSDFIPYYNDGIPKNEPKWIWDYNPTSLADAWLRIKINLP